MRNTSPRCTRNWLYSVFLRHFGMNTMWYLHSHLVWFKLLNLSIVALPFVCLAAHVGSLYNWTPPKTSNFYCHPGRAGGTPLLASPRLAAGAARGKVTTAGGRNAAVVRGGFGG